jgi:hypothetical protein
MQQAELERQAAIAEAREQSRQDAIDRARAVAARQSADVARAREAFERELRKTQEEQRAQSAAAEQAAREDELRTRFALRLPSGSERDYQAMRVALLAELALEAAARQEATRRLRYAI